VKSKNPIKTRFFILISAGLIFLVLKIETGIVWIPLIFFLLFTGGILLIFMILSSVLPNEKTIKIKFSKVRILVLALVAIIPRSFIRGGKEELESHIKRFLSSGTNIILITRIILLYFFNSIQINTTEEYSMRSLQC
jgi:hypothetical protein